ncbi:MAG: serine protease [Alphaproteobacteria bacterium]|nr:serine protease [Alphaproteobacteria bacterium]
MSERDPRPEHLSYDLNRVLASVVGITSHIPEDAFTASILGTERVGSGVVIRDNGLILTIGYLVTEAETLWITDNRGRAVSGMVLGYDQETGFGLVQALTALDLPAIEIGASSEVREGDQMVLAGAGGRRAAITTQVIAVREFAGYWEYLLDEAIFTAPAHPNWGGASLIDAEGRLVGIGSLFIQQSQGGGQPVDGNMVVPIDLLTPVLDDLTLRGGRNAPPRPWLGLYATEIEDRVVVAGMANGGPAEQAELETGDLVLRVADYPVNTLAELFRQVWAQGPAGVEVPIAVSRDGEQFDLVIESVARGSLLKMPKLH